MQRFAACVPAPAASPRAIIDRVSGEIGGIVATADFQDKVAAQGMIPIYANPEQRSVLIRSDTANYAEAIKIVSLRF